MLKIVLPVWLVEAAVSQVRRPDGGKSETWAFWRSPMEGVN